MNNIKELEKMIQDDKLTKNHLLNKLSDIQYDFSILTKEKEEYVKSLKEESDKNYHLNEKNLKFRKVIAVLLDEYDNYYD